MVEYTAHNGTNAGSSPTKSNIYFNINYDKKTKTSFNRFFGCVSYSPCRREFVQENTC